MSTAEVDNELEVERKWISQQFALVVEETKFFEGTEGKKQELIDDVLGRLDPVKREVQYLSTFTVQMRGVVTKKMKSMTGKGGVDNTEFDTVHDTANIKELDDNVIPRMTKAHEICKGLARELEEAEGDGGEKLFTAKEISDVFWKPLVRAGIFPDNFVLDEYNETVRVFKGANELYQERIKEDTTPEDGTEGLATVREFSGDVTAILGTINDLAGGPAIVGTIIEQTDLVIKATTTIVEGTMKRDAKGFLDGIAVALEGCLKAAGCPSDISGLVTGGFKASSKAGLGLAALKKMADDGATVNELLGEAFSCFGEAIGASFGMCDKKGESKFTDIGERISGAMTAVGKTPAVVEAIRQGKIDIALRIVVTQTQTVVSKEIETIGEEGGDVGKALASVSDDLKEKLEEDLEEKEQELFAKELQEEDEEGNFEDELQNCLVGAAQDDPEALERAHYSIEKMIVKIERTRAALKIAEGIFDTGMKTAAEFFEPLKIATASKDFIKHMILAVKRGMQLNQWIDEVEQAANAASVYSAVFYNRVKNLRVQVSQNTINALIDLTQIIAGGLACGGMTSGAGIILGKAATAAQQASDLGFKIADRVDAKVQWHKYRKCLDLMSKGMTDRKMMRDVLGGNPTLSKYAMAYGALVEKDPIALAGMRRCGLTEDNLESADAAVVVRYLETKFDYDPQLIRALPQTDWYDSAADASVKTWGDALTQAQTKIKLSRQGTGAIDGGFSRFDAQKPIFAQAQTAFEAVYPAFKQIQKKFEYQATLKLVKDAQAQFDKVKLEYEKAVTEKTNAEKAAEGKEGEELEAARAEIAKVDVKLIDLGGKLTGAAKMSEQAIPHLSQQAKLIDEFKVRALQVVGPIPPFVEARSKLALEGNRLVKSLKKFKPVFLEGGDEFKSAPDVRGFIDAMVQKVNGAVEESEATYEEITPQTATELNQKINEAGSFKTAAAEDIKNAFAWQKEANKFVATISKSETPEPKASSGESPKKKKKKKSRTK